MTDHNLDLDAIKAAVEAHVAAGGTANAVLLLEANPAALLDYAIEGRDLALRSAARITDLLAEVERLKANQQPDGGEWRVERGLLGETGQFWIATRPKAPATHQRRVWTGPAEPLSKPSDTPPESTTDQTAPQTP